MAFSVSPRVAIREIDLTNVVPAVSSTEGAIAGVFRWGPVDDRTLISSENELVKRFGRPNDDNFQTFMSAANFLSYSNALWVSRAADVNSRNAYASTGVVTQNVLIKNEEDYAGKVASFDPNVLYYARYPGALGNSLRVSVCDSPTAFRDNRLGIIDAAFLSSISLSPDVDVKVQVSAAVGSSTVTFACSRADDDLTSDAVETTVANLTDVANALLARITIGDQLLLNGQYVKVKSKSAVTQSGGVGAEVLSFTLTLENRYTQATPFSQTITSGSVTGITRVWEFADLVDRAPGRSQHAAELGVAEGVADEIHVVVVDEDGLFTGTSGAVLEVFEGLSRGTNARASVGGTNYYKTVINERSQYIWFAKDRGGALSAPLSPTFVASTNTLPFSASMTGGADSASETTIAAADVLRAWDQFKNADEVDVSLLIVGPDRANGQITNYLIDNIAEVRKDCVVFASPYITTTVGNAQAAEAIVEYRNLLRSTSYAFLDSGYKYQYDRYNDVFRWVPLNGDIAGLCARTDELRDPWWSPAGFNRGNIKNIVKLAFNPDQAERDLLYKAGINPVVNFKGQGVILYGDKTLLSTPSAFDRINVRRLFIVLEKAIATAAKGLLFEFNDEFTRAQFRNLIEPYLRDVQGRRGIVDFRVVADSTNNTGEVIDRNEFVGDIYIKPPRSINYITLNFVAVRTGVEFNEIVGNY